MPKTLIIGAGVSGLTSLKCALDADLGEVHCFEQSNVIGGLWNYRENYEVGQGSVIESTFTNTSKEMTSFSDYPFPPNWPNYMKHSKFMEYLEMYVDKFSLLRHIYLEHKVESVNKLEDGGFLVSYSNGKNKSKSESYDFIMVCNGKFFDPRIVSFKNQDQFKGEIIHSLKYKTADKYRNKNVCVIGFGNTAADIATDLSKVAKQVYLSNRSGAFLKRRTGYDGLPDDFISNSRLRYIMKKWQPRWYKERALEKRLSTVLNSSIYGIRPTKSISRQFITVSDDIQCRLIQGSVILARDVARFHEHQLEFIDGKKFEIDTVITATGYTVNVGFLCPGICQVKDEVDLYLKMFLPECENLAFIGYTNPLGSIPPVSEMQARYACQVFKGTIHLPTESKMKQVNQNTRRSLAANMSPEVRYQFTVNRYAYLEFLADGIGCRPGVIRLLSDPVLAWRCWTGAFTTQQYRLFGPNKWAGARSSLLGNRERMLTPLGGGDLPGWGKCQVGAILSAGIAVCGLMLYKTLYK